MKEYTPEMFVELWARAGLNPRSPKEKKLDLAQRYASEVRARKPQMQVRRKDVS